ncbi:hypothetical protein IV203_013185 [Nitzschia inconspicua]|uniref:Uncharacterized protein n=1 Tax=Nitzschia inconspicua TaxID=303405 RepID=A0A9K3M5G5_9STRA|nr:hypothetical protein IV203_013185 [Nitzschia inconspicua]
MWPLSPSSAFLLLAIVVPSDFYLNRGFTQWFHWAAIYYSLTQWQFLERFQILSGCSICLGWYASLVYEFVQYGRFCHPLYKNMPTSLMQFYLRDVEGNGSTQGQQMLDFESTKALLALTMAHILDLLAHPLLTYYFWRRHTTKGGTIKQVVAWPVIAAAYLYSRLWSLTHTKYNTGNFDLWYFGFDIYVMDSLDSWYPAYIAETCFYGGIIILKLNEIWSKKLLHASAKKDCFETKPKLLLSESSVSIESHSS